MSTFSSKRFVLAVCVCLILNRNVASAGEEVFVVSTSDSDDTADGPIIENNVSWVFRGNALPGNAFKYEIDMRTCLCECSQSRTRGNSVTVDLNLLKI